MSSTAAVGLRSSRNNIGTLDARLNILMYSVVYLSVLCTLRFINIFVTNSNYCINYKMQNIHENVLKY